jgi:hypothetical protein
MTDPAHYPFSGSATELTHLTIFDEAILKYAKWKINPMFNKDMMDLSENEYKREREEKTWLSGRRKDIAASADARLRMG